MHQTILRNSSRKYRVTRLRGYAVTHMVLYVQLDPFQNARTALNTCAKIRFLILFLHALPKWHWILEVLTLVFHRHLQTNINSSKLQRKAVNTLRNRMSQFSLRNKHQFLYRHAHENSSLAPIAFPFLWELTDTNNIDILGSLEIIDWRSWLLSGQD